jgi:hypothetical protein
MFTLSQADKEFSVAQPMKERRRYRRYPIVRSARILANAGTIECSTIDISASGLKLYLLGTGSVPRRFVFCFGNREQFVGQLVNRQGRIARIRLLSEKPIMAQALRGQVSIDAFLTPLSDAE